MSKAETKIRFYIEQWRTLGLEEVANRAERQIAEGKEPTRCDLFEVPDPDESPAKVDLALKNMGHAMAHAEFVELRTRDLGTPDKEKKNLEQDYCGEI